MQLQATEKERRENVMHSNTSGEESKSTRHRNNTWARMNKFGKAKLADDNATNPLKKGHTGSWNYDWVKRSRYDRLKTLFHYRAPSNFWTVYR